MKYIIIQIGPRGEKIRSGQAISLGQTDGRMERWTEGQTDQLITIRRSQSGALIMPGYENIFSPY